MGSLFITDEVLTSGLKYDMISKAFKNKKI